MATIEAIEANSRKIETLTKVARLLGDQIREQNIKIDKLQEEINELKERIGRAAIPIESAFQKPKEVFDTDRTPTQFQSFQEKPQMPVLTQEMKEKAPKVLVAKDSDKEELLRALEVIDNL